MTTEQYDEVLRMATEEATAMVQVEDNRPNEFDDSAWDKFHDVLFGRVLTAVDNDEALADLDAREVSVVCDEVENDIRHGDILGL